MIFYGWQKISLIEWPNKISTVLFVSGCNFKCPFCYNRDLVLNYDRLPKISQRKILNFLKLRQRLIDGVIITGGEPLSGVAKTKNYFNDLFNFIKKVKKLGLKIGIETNGSDPEILEKLIKEKLIDFVAMDIKAPLNAKYEELTGVKVDLNKIKKSIEIIKNSEIDYEFRTTVAPLLSEKDILEIAEELKTAKKYALQVFQPVDTLIEPSLAKMRFLNRKELEEISKKIKDNFQKFEIRG